MGLLCRNRLTVAAGEDQRPEIDASARSLLRCIAMKVTIAAPYWVGPVRALAQFILDSAWWNEQRRTVATDTILPVLVD
jgi:hypothetical protein